MRAGFIHMDDMYEDYQGIYDKTVGMQMEKETDRKNEDRGRGRESDAPTRLLIKEGCVFVLVCWI